MNLWCDLLIPQSVANVVNVLTIFFRNPKLFLLPNRFLHQYFQVREWNALRLGDTKMSSQFTSNSCNHLSFESCNSSSILGSPCSTVSYLHAPSTVNSFCLFDDESERVIFEEELQCSRDSSKEKHPIDFGEQSSATADTEILGYNRDDERPQPNESTVERAVSSKAILRENFADYDDEALMIHFLIHFYQEVNPLKLTNVQQIARHYKNRKEQLLHDLKAIYNVPLPPYPTKSNA